MEKKLSITWYCCLWIFSLMLFLTSCARSGHDGNNATNDTIIISSATPAALAAPTELIISAATDTQVTLAWKDNSDNEEGFTIERSTDGIAFTIVGQDAPNVVVYTDTNLSPTVTYYYRVKAYNSAGDSGYSNIIIKLVHPQSGALDKEFGTDGIVMPNAGGAVLVQQNGMILTADWSFGGTNSTFNIARFDSAGRLDPTFGNAGKAHVVVPGAALLSGAVLQTDGKIVIAGTANNGADNDIVIVRFDQTGLLDSTFGSAGVYRSQAGTDELSNDVAIQEDGKIVVAGFAQDDLNDDLDFLVARYTTAGAPDIDFGSQGSIKVPLGRQDGLRRTASFHTVAVASDGSIVAAGMGSVDYQTSSYDILAIARYHPDGSPDVTFGPQGIMLVDASCNFPQDIALQQDGKIVVTAFLTAESSGTSQYCLMRFDQDGHPDPTFGTAGTVITKASSQALAIQTDGKILAAGQVYENGCGDFELARYSSNGIIDETFGNGGSVTLHFGTSWSWATALALQPDGKIVSSGTIQPEGSFIVRYFP